MSKTAYRLISVGYVAENKSRQTDEIEVSLIELTPFINGELKGDIVTDTCNGVDSKGNHFSASVKMSNTVIATWKGEGTNRVTSPDVRRGDRVNIYRYGNNDKYYWEPLEHVGESVKKRETVTHTYSNTTDEKDNTPTVKNSYIQEVSTHDKLVTLIQTSKSDGEKFQYVVQVNTKENVIVLADDVGNFIQLDSNGSHVVMQNADGSLFEVIKGDININCKGNVNIEAGGNVNIKTPNTYITSSTQIKGDTDINGSFATKGSFTNNGVNVGSGHVHRNGGGRGNSGTPA